MKLLRTYLVSCLIALESLHAQSQVGGRTVPEVPTGRVPQLQPPPEMYNPSKSMISVVSDFYHALGWLNTYAKRLEKSRANRLPEARQPLQQIQSDATFLQKKWLEWGQRHPGQNPYSGPVKLDPYFRALDGSVKQLKELKKANDTELLSIIKAVADDLRAKAENCRNSSDGLGKNINVTVRTKKGTAEVSGYEVYCAPVALVKFKNEHLRFPKISSPTIYRNLAPGHYAMWLRIENEKTEPVTQTIGGQGEKEVEVDLLVSSESSAPK